LIYLKGLASLVVVLDFEPLTDQLGSIRVPTMILNGEFDFLTPRALHETLRTQIPDSALGQSTWIDLAALAHAAHGAIRPAALLPGEADSQDAFVLALRQVEFESSRLIQAQILFLKGPDLIAVRAAVTAAVEQRHRQVREAFETMLAGIGVERQTKD
jgi:hypothetical protein